MRRVHDEHETRRRHVNRRAHRRLVEPPEHKEVRHPQVAVPVRHYAARQISEPAPGPRHERGTPARRGRVRHPLPPVTHDNVRRPRRGGVSGDRVAVHDRRPVHHDHRRRQHGRRDRLSTTDGVGRLVAGLLAVARAVVDHRPGHPQHPRTEGDRPDRVGGGAQRLPGEGPPRRRRRGTHADVHLVRTIRIIQACRADLRDVAGQSWHSQPAALGEP